jgi:hypothetical protein
MLVPKNLIWASLKNNAARQSVMASKNKKIQIENRLITKKLWHHPGVQREEEQEADQQLALHRGAKVLGDFLQAFKLWRPHRHKDQGGQLV